MEPTMINSLFTVPTPVSVVMANTVSIVSSVEQNVVGIDQYGSELVTISKCNEQAKLYLYKILDQSNDPTFLDNLNLDNLFISDKLFRVMAPYNCFDKQLEFHIDTDIAYLKEIQNDKATYKILNANTNCDIVEEFYSDSNVFNNLFSTDFKPGPLFSALKRLNPIYTSYLEAFKADLSNIQKG